jgi:hypothetical protein
MYIADNPLTSGDVSIDQILEVLHSHANEFIPQRFCSDQSRRRKYSLKAVKQVVAKLDPANYVSLDLERTDLPEVTYSFDFVQKRTPGLQLGIKLPLDSFDHPDHGKERAQHFVSLVTALANLLHPIYGYAHNQADASLGTDPHTSDPFAPVGVYEIHWLNIYGKELVDQLGRDRVLSTPCFHCEELAGGGVLLLSRPTPLDYASDEARVAQAAALAHLRSDITYEQALAMLRQRSITLFPTKEHWDPDLVDLLELIVRPFPFEEGLRLTVQYNTYRPPEVCEWLPLDKLLPSDVEDEGDTELYYEEKYAKDLVRWYRETVRHGNEIQIRPESLPPLDYCLWAYLIPSKDNSDLIPYVGAFLGRVLVDYLEGEWVPRKNIEEAQVVVGDRVWLPFLRANHCLQSKDAALDYSLTKFYRTVERYVRGEQA